jgi:iron complex outermembrane receptor protein
MNRSPIHPHRFACLATTAVVLLATPNGLVARDEAVTELEEFSVVETKNSRQGHLAPTSRDVLSVFGAQSILDVPRAVTVITPELMEQLRIDDFSDLAKLGAGTQQINYYGVPGTPSVRGARGGVFVLGIQRAFQRNEMPLSFGSLEAMDVVKGPAPAHFGPAQVGGYVNLIPKSPYFDRRRGSIRTEIGSYDSYRVQLDVGGPFLLAGRPAAYRVSLTGQDADSYYDRIGNDFVSLYAALKTRLAKETTLFAGTEFFRYSSNENAGWNRPTQRLVDTGAYVVGEPLSIVSPAWGGVAARNLLYRNTALVVPAALVDAGVASGFVTPVQRDAMLDLSDPAARARAYAAFSPAELAGIQQSTTGYQYTSEYFAAGGRVFTAPIEGGTVLASPDDYADSKNLLSFAELSHAAGPRRTLKAQLLVDWIETDKLSTYGYAVATRQLLVELRASLEERFDALGGTKLVYGLSARRTDAKMLQDFFDEPFSRRDVSAPTISPNSVIPTGPQTDPNGVNFWSPTAQGGANAHSTLRQFSAFAYMENKPTAHLATYTSVLVAHAPYTTRYPAEVDRVPADDPRRAGVSAHRDYYSASFSPVLTIAPGVNVYSTAQYGTSVDPLQGGAIVGAGNFARNRLLEAGAKASLFEGRVFASFAAYEWRQTQYDQRANNAELLEGRGAEFEFTWNVTSAVTLVGSAGRQRVKRFSDLGFRTIPLTEEQIALRGGVLNTPFSGIAPRPGFGPYARPASNPDLVYPGTPETQAKLLAVVNFAGGFGISGGPVWSDGYWHNFDRTIRLPASIVWNATVYWRTPRFDVSLSLENVFDEDWFLGAEPVFAANTLITKAPGTNGRLAFTWKY